MEELWSSKPGRAGSSPAEGTNFAFVAEVD